MKAKELAGYLLENPDWDVVFWFSQIPDEINDFCERMFNVVDVGDETKNKKMVLVGDEVRHERQAKTLH